MWTVTTLMTFMLVVWSVQATNAWLGSMYQRNRSPVRPEFDEDKPILMRPVARTGVWYQQRRSGMNLLEDEPVDPAVNCKGLPCRNDDGCCESMICKLPEPEARKNPDPPYSPLGTCIPNPNEGEVCKQDIACGHGMECVITAGSRGFKTCQPKIRDISRKQYKDDCRLSIECDQSRGLCCQVFRRPRSAPRQVCARYEEVHHCIGFRKDYMADVDPTGNGKTKWYF